MEGSSMSAPEKGEGQAAGRGPACAEGWGVGMTASG